MRVNKLRRCVFRSRSSHTNRAENARLGADVSDEEWDAYCENFIEVDNIGRAATTNDGSWARAQATYRQDVNALIRARAAPSQTRDEAGK